MLCLLRNEGGSVNLTRWDAALLVLRRMAEAAEERVEELEDIYLRCEAICSDGELGVTMESLRNEIKRQDQCIAQLKAQLAKAREDTARRCAEIADPTGKPSNCRTCAIEIRDAIRREFDIDSAREKGGA